MPKVISIIVLFLLAATLVLAQETPLPSPTPSVQFNFPNGIDLPSLIDYVRKISPKPLIYDPAALQGKRIALESEKPVPADELMPLLRSVLELAGLTIIDEPSALKITTSEKALTQALPILTASEASAASPETRLTVFIFPLVNLPAQNALQALNNLVPRGGLSVVGGANILIIIDYATKARFWSDLIARIDVPPDRGVPAVIRLEHARAKDLADRLSLFLEDSSKTPSAAAPIKIEADERSNSLLVRAPKPDLDEIRKIVQELDVEFKAPSEFNFYKMKFARAETLAGQLNDILSRTPAKAAPEEAKTAPPPSIIAIPDRNTLLIRATPDEFRQISALLEELDKSKRQVFTEAALVEVSTDNLLDLGVELATVDQPGEGPRGFGFSLHGFSSVTIEDDNFVRVPITTPTAAIASGLIIGVTKESAALIPFMLRAHEQDLGANIIATPKLVSNDNERATFKTANAIPTVTFSTTDTTTDVRSFGGFQEAQIYLAVTPTITSQDSTILDIELLVEQFVGTQLTPELPPSKTQRLITTKVTIPNNLTVVIGGLKADVKKDETSRVPFLGRIPVLGFFFRRTTTVTQSKTLYMFLTPHIESFEEGAQTIKSLTEQKLRELHEKGAQTEILPAPQSTGTPAG